jgi:hypothetical protein
MMTKGAELVDPHYADSAYPGGEAEVRRLHGQFYVRIGGIDVFEPRYSKQRKAVAADSEVHPLILVCHAWLLFFPAIWVIEGIRSFTRYGLPPDAGEVMRPLILGTLGIFLTVTAIGHFWLFRRYSHSAFYTLPVTAMTLFFANILTATF